MKIALDYLPGTHGHYLAFVLNKLLLGNKILIDEPFTEIGSSHVALELSNYLEKRPVIEGHFFWAHKNRLIEHGHLPNITTNNIIRITVEKEDLLTFFQLSWCRGGLRNFDPRDIESNLYNKLVNTPRFPGDFNDFVGKYINKMYQTVTLDLYNYLRDQSEERLASWPTITTPLEFNSLPVHIKEEYNTEFGFPFFGLSSEYPSCPRYVFRDYIQKTGFSNNQVDQDINEYSSKNKRFNDKNTCLYNFEFQSFYKKDKFLKEIQKIREFFNLDFVDFDIEQLHDKFLSKQPQKNLRQTISNIMQNIIQRSSLLFPELSVIEESYINSQVEQLYGIELPLIKTVKFPKSVTELVKQYGLNNL